jgi:hypothetical protein
VKNLLDEKKVPPNNSDPARRDLAHMMRKVKDQMKHVWSDVQNFGVSNEVFMVEVEVIHRLRSDGVNTRLLSSIIIHTVINIEQSSSFTHGF